MAPAVTWGWWFSERCSHLCWAFPKLCCQHKSRKTPRKEGVLLTCSGGGNLSDFAGQEEMLSLAGETEHLRT